MDQALVVHDMTEGERQPRGGETNHIMDQKGGNQAKP